MQHAHVPMIRRMVILLVLTSLYITTGRDILNVEFEYEYFSCDVCNCQQELICCMSGVVLHFRNVIVHACALHQHSTHHAIGEQQHHAFVA